MELIMLVSPLVLSGRLTDNQRAVRKHTAARECGRADCSCNIISCAGRMPYVPFKQAGHWRITASYCYQLRELFHQLQ